MQDDINIDNVDNVGNVDDIANAAPLQWVGFNRPIIVSENLADFFTTADLGRIDNLQPLSDDNPNINDVLEMLAEYGMTTSNILTHLFALYAWRHKLTARADINRDRPDHNITDHI